LHYDKASRNKKYYFLKFACISRAVVALAIDKKAYHRGSTLRPIRYQPLKNFHSKIALNVGPNLWHTFEISTGNALIFIIANNNGFLWLKLYLMVLCNMHIKTKLLYITLATFDNLQVQLNCPLPNMKKKVDGNSK
jgi:hypothetical protein